MRGFTVSEITKDNNHPDTDGLLHYNFYGMLEAAFIDSLQHKSFEFHKALKRLNEIIEKYT